MTEDIAAFDYLADLHAARNPAELEAAVMPAKMQRWFNFLAAAQGNVCGCCSRPLRAGDFLPVAEAMNSKTPVVCRACFWKVKALMVSP